MKTRIIHFAILLMITIILFAGCDKNKQQAAEEQNVEKPPRKRKT